MNFQLLLLGDGGFVNSFHENTNILNKAMCGEVSSCQHPLLMLCGIHMKNVIKIKKHTLFSPGDIAQMKRLGLDAGAVRRQLGMYVRGATFLRLNRPCTVNDGILSCHPGRMKKLISFFEKESQNYKMIKFVPASGAASRMFSEWFQAAGKNSFGSSTLDQLFRKNFPKLPFAGLIKPDSRGRQSREEEGIGRLLQYVLSPDGLNYGKLPKALIAFHRYPSGEIRTALEEHLCEAAYYIRDARKTCHIHFTVAPGFKKESADYLNKVITDYEKSYKIKYKVSFSIQEPSTSTLAVDQNGTPLRNEKGRLVFRPGGHGTLLKNLNALDADFVFVKNIDNVVPENILREIIPYKKMMGGLAIRSQEEIFENIRRLKNPKITSLEMESIAAFCSDKLGVDFPVRFSRSSDKEKKIFYVFGVEPAVACLRHGQK